MRPWMSRWLRLAMHCARGRRGVQRGGRREDPSGRRAGSTCLVTRIAFGSCMHQSKAKPVLDLAAAAAPDLFLFLGGNLYGDTDDVAVLQERYDLLAAAPSSSVCARRCRRSPPGTTTTTAATTPARVPLQGRIQGDVPRLRGSRGFAPLVAGGIYTSHLFGEPGGTLQVIFLGTRWFRVRSTRTPIRSASSTTTCPPRTRHARCSARKPSGRGFEGRAARPADVRIVATSIQLCQEYNGWESWDEEHAPREAADGRP